MLGIFCRDSSSEYPKQPDVSEVVLSPVSICYLSNGRFSFVKSADVFSLRRMGHSTHSCKSESAVLFALDIVLGCGSFMYFCIISSLPARRNQDLEGKAQPTTYPSAACQISLSIEEWLPSYLTITFWLPPLRRESQAH